MRTCPRRHAHNCMLLVHMHTTACSHAHHCKLKCTQLNADMLSAACYCSQARSYMLTCPQLMLTCTLLHAHKHTIACPNARNYCTCAHAHEGMLTCTQLHAHMHVTTCGQMNAHMYAHYCMLTCMHTSACSHGGGGDTQRHANMHTPKRFM